MRAGVMLVSLAALAACGGTFGGTSSFTLDVAEPASAPLRHVVRVASVEAARDANEVDSVGTFHLGKLDEGELADLRKSLASTLQQVAWPSGLAPSESFDLHLLVTHYYVAHSNNDGAILAAIDWALADAERQVAFSELFYASVQADDVKGLNTLGKVKDLLNQQVVRRVVDTSLLVSANPESIPQVSVEHTYATAQQAAAPLPRRLTSMFGLPQFSTKGVDWAQGAQGTPIDWSQRLASPD